MIYSNYKLLLIIINTLFIINQTNNHHLKVNQYLIEEIITNNYHYKIQLISIVVIKDK